MNQAPTLLGQILCCPQCAGFPVRLDSVVAAPRDANGWMTQFRVVCSKCGHTSRLSIGAFTDSRGVRVSMWDDDAGGA